MDPTLIFDLHEDIAGIAATCCVGDQAQTSPARTILKNREHQGHMIDR